MSTNSERIPLVKAQQIAQKITLELAPYCARVEIAGSIRRKKETVGDIEIVALLNRPLTNETLIGLVGGKMLNDGTMYRKILLDEGINLDLFVVDKPEKWGFVLVQRTGPADFNTWLFTTRNRCGARPVGLEFHDCRSFENGHQVDTYEEEDFFGLFGLGWIAPEQRDRERYKLPYTLKARKSVTGRQIIRRPENYDEINPFQAA